MKHHLEFAYAQARIQARLAALPTEQEWRRLAATRTLASFLEEARDGALREWVKGFSSQSDVHDLEAGVRLLFREILATLADWVPVPWRDAVYWAQWLMLLPLLASLKSGRSMPRWVARDPVLQALLGDKDGLSNQDLVDVGGLCLLQSEGDPLTAWTQEWHHRWPGRGRQASRELVALSDLLLAHLDAFRHVQVDSAWRLRRELRERLRLRFHRQALQPVIPFIYLALVALDLERLRAALVSRLLFAEPDEATWTDRVGRAVA